MLRSESTSDRVGTLFQSKNRIEKAANVFIVINVLLIIAAASWLALPRVASATLRDLGAWLASACAITGWGFCWYDLMGQLHSDGLVLLLLGLPSASLLFLGAARAASARNALLALGTIMALMTALTASVLDRGTAAAFCCIVLGVAVAVWGASVRARLCIVGGALVALWGIGLQVWLAVHVDNLLRWLSLTAVGILLIVGSAYIERNRARLTRFWQLRVATK